MTRRVETPIWEKVKGWESFCLKEKKKKRMANKNSQIFEHMAHRRDIWP